MLEPAYIFEWLAALAGLVFFYKYKQFPIKWVLVLVWLTVFVETAAKFQVLFIDGTNHLIYNCYLITSYPLLYYIIYSHMQHPLRKKIVAGIAIAVTTAMLFRAFTTPFLTTFMVYMFSLAVIGLVAILLLYAIDLLKSNNQITFKNRLELFVFAGYMIFGISYIPLSYVLTSFEFIQLGPETMSILYGIQNSTVIFMNILFIVGLIWTDPRKQISN